MGGSLPMLRYHLSQVSTPSLLATLVLSTVWSRARTARLAESGTASHHPSRSRSPLVRASIHSGMCCTSTNHLGGVGASDRCGSARWYQATSCHAPHLNPTCWYTPTAWKPVAS